MGMVYTRKMTGNYNLKRKRLDLTSSIGKLKKIKHKIYMYMINRDINVKIKS